MYVRNMRLCCEKDFALLPIQKKQLQIQLHLTSFSHPLGQYQSLSTTKMAMYSLILCTNLV